MLSDEQVQKFIDAMRGPGPSWDPDWKLTQQLIRLTVAQNREIINLQAQIDALTQANTASSAQLFGCLQRRLNIARNQISATDVQIGVKNMDAALKAAANGQQVAQYAGYALKFAAKLLL